MTTDAPRDDRARAEPTPDPLPPHAEPVVTGTVFIMLVFLMALAGLWGIMYLLLLGR